jgi:hypothetical protein
LFLFVNYRGVALSVSSWRADPVANLAQDEAAFDLIDNVLCETG